MNAKKALVCGADGFIGHHLVNYLKQEGYWVKGIDIKINTYARSNADTFIKGDLRNQKFCEEVIDESFDEVYQLAADMGGAGYIFVGNNDADIMHSNVMINLNILDVCYQRNVKNLLFSSSACVYPAYNQLDPDTPKTSEESTYPAAPDSEYGWEKLFSERIYLSFHRCKKMNIKIARLHNIFGPEGSWNDGREKSPAAICRKIATAKNGEKIEIWGDGNQTRSYLYIDECLQGLRKLMNSSWTGPVNLGSEEMVTINELAKLVMKIAGKNLQLEHIPGPLGVRGRKSDNHMIKQMLGWSPSYSLKEGLEKTYLWIESQVKHNRSAQSFRPR